MLSVKVNASIHKSSWDNLNEENNINSIALYKLANWQISTSDGIIKDSLPFYSNSYDSITLQNTFTLPMDSLNLIYILKSNGFHGVTKVFINDNLVFESPNGSAPFKVKVGTDILKMGKENSIKILLVKSASFINSFPRFTHLFTEPEYLGIMRSFYLLPANQTLIQSFIYKIEDVNNYSRVNYTYSLNRLFARSFEKKDGLSYLETIRDSKGNILSQKAITSSDKEPTINGSIKLKPEQLWTPDNPVSFNFEITVNRFGQPQHSKSKRVSFRDIQYKDNFIFINDKSSQIRGVSYYENLESAWNKPVLSKVEEHLRSIKDDGFNAVRFVSHIPDDRFLTVADSIGLLVFIDMPVKRFPKDAFKQDNLLENLKNSVSRTLDAFVHHPSLVAIGLGNEVLLSDPSTQKFFLILNGLIKRDVPFLTYLSSAPEGNLALDNVADFFILDIYESINKRISIIKKSNIPFILAGKATISSSYNYLNDMNPNFAINRKKLISKEMNLISNELGYQGGFFESFIDWHSNTATHQTLINNDRIIKNGLYDSTFTKYEWAEELNTPIWEYSYLGELNNTQKDKSTNIFSIVMFFVSLMFFFFYRRYPRLSENYKRSIAHPYGFYVDLRERRIIPVFNSFVTGVHNALILTIFVGSFIFYYNDSFFIQEILRTLFPAFLYHYILEISQSEWFIMWSLFILIAMYPLYIGLAVKVYSIISRRSVRTRQALAVGLWSGSPIIFLLPFSFAAYHFILKGGYNQVLLIIFAIFILWIQFRLINGIRVLLLSKFQSIFILLLLSYSIPVVIFLILSDHPPMWTDYLITLLNSHTLF